MTVRAIDVDSPVQAPGTLAGWRAVVRSVPVPLVQALLIAFCLYLLLEGWHRDWRVPLAFSSDSLWYLAQSKSTVDNGWWWWNPRLGAPFGLDARAYPSNSNVDHAVLWFVSRIVSHPIAAINLTWGLLVVLSGLSATWCMRKLGVSAFLAVVAGVLFALSPYALYRHIDHFALVIYLVPFACVAAGWLAAGQPHQAWGRAARGVVFAGCALLGFDYVYYAFFGCFCIAAGAIVGYLAHRNRGILASGALCIAVISGSTLLNLSPSLYSWHQDGRPTVLRDKVPAEAETFGLKIRQVISPVFPHQIAPFDWWVRREAAARFPNENENWTSRLGLIGTFGFLALLALLFIPDGASLASVPVVRGASRVTLALVLLATVGGFGSVFNLLVSPDIRAYNRVLPFIAFFSLLAVVIALERRFRTPHARLAVASIVLVVGIADQGQAARRVNERYDAIATEVSDLQTFVRGVERALPPRAMVFQLPLRTYMSESDFGRMKQYDHFKPYLVSETLRFSYPALSNEQVRWQRGAARLEIASLTTAVAGAGFSAVLVDRYGYDDDGAAVIAALQRVAGEARTIATTSRFFAIDIAGIAGNANTDAIAAAMEAVPLTLSLPSCAGPPMMIIDQIGASRAPFTAAGAQIPPDGEVRVSGWAVDHPQRMPAAGVDIAIDRRLFPTTYGLVRRDVADYFQRPNYEDTGFVASIPAGTLAAGEHFLSLRVVSSDGACYYQSAPVRVMVGR